MNAPRETILVLEDDVASRHDLARLLEGAGYDVFTADTIEASLHAAREKGVDLVLLDEQFSRLGAPPESIVPDYCRYNPTRRPMPIGNEKRLLADWGRSASKTHCPNAGTGEDSAFLSSRPRDRCGSKVRVWMGLCGCAITFGVDYQVLFSSQC